MSKTLAIGYALCIATLGVMILLGRGAIPQLDGFTAFFYSSLGGLLMFPGSVLCFRGARLSQGRIRKVLAYLVSVLSLLVGLSSAVAVILVSLGSAKPG
jgi:hypothetical protein